MVNILRNTFGMLLFFALFSLAFMPAVTNAEPTDGQIVVDKSNAAWFKYHNGEPHFLAAAGDPEDFLFRGELLPDGTRAGDQLEIIQKLASTGVNGIYFQAIRSHGGDGNETHNPFLNNDATQGFNELVLQQWDEWLAELDRLGIVSYFFFYDDEATIWDTGDVVEDAEAQFILTLVNRYKHLKNLVWVVAEEYEERFTAKRIKAIAKLIKQADDYQHPIAIHKLEGLSFSEFESSDLIDQFAIQYNNKSADEINTAMVQAFETARGRYNINFSESASMGERDQARKKLWAAAMGGAYVMVLGMDVASTPEPEMMDLQRLRQFMESTKFSEMKPNNQLASGKVNYVLSNENHFILYANDAYSNKWLTTKLGIKHIEPGAYNLLWYDAETGYKIEGMVEIEHAGSFYWQKPKKLGSEIALYISPLIKH